MLGKAEQVCTSRHVSMHLDEPLLKPYHCLDGVHVQRVGRRLQTFINLAIHLNLQPFREPFNGMVKEKQAFQPQPYKHKHCLICGLPIPVNKTFCGAECEEKNRRLEKRKNYTMIITMIMFPVLLLLMLLFSKPK